MFAAILLSAAIALTPPPALPSPERVLGLVRAQFRSHRPPPRFVTYTLIRTQKTDTGFPDYVGSYTYHYWVRSSDRAALKRKVFRDIARGPLEFERPAFNEARDPGPPTADLFEPAPAHPRGNDFVPTPEAEQTPLPVIGSVRAVGEYDYRVSALTVEDDLLHLKLEPIRDPDRNRLRELWVTRSNYELRKLVATDKLFVTGSETRTYGVIFTVELGMLSGMPVVTDIHGEVQDGYQDDGKAVDFKFRDITFPASLPDWYFDVKQYHGREQQAPL